MKKITKGYIVTTYEQTWLSKPMEYLFDDYDQAYEFYKSHARYEETYLYSEQEYKRLFGKRG